MILQQALDEVQKEIEGKVDKIEISPLKEFVNQRLKVLQDKLKKVAEAREEIEAAGTKKLLRDVQCISCDKDVVMRMDGVPRFKVETLPCTTSMKPYLTYELDQVRKQHRKLPHSRNMIQFEAAIQEEAKKQRSARAEALVKTPRYLAETTATEGDDQESIGPIDASISDRGMRYTDDEEIGDQD
ncbi:uveal autoantigen with coiled-coil domains and ankyrin repeats protein-like isoform X2 [Apis mellifera caucasica]|nr:uveal autoantigen with coiled-coil domains and ankyrin repeats protein-like isoform X2 [Apis mellifera caucasica]